MQNKIRVLVVMMVALIIFIMFNNLKISNYQYLLETRTPKVMAIILVGICIGVSSKLFQIIVNSRILTPSVMGFDALYVFIETVIIFVFSSNAIILTQKIPKFFLTMLIMVSASILFQKIILRKNKVNILYMVLVGIVFGIFLNSFSSMMQMLMDPNEFLILQNKLFASFLKVDLSILFIAYILVAFTFVYISDEFKNLDVLSLGYDHAVNLGIDYNKSTKRMLIAISILVSIAAALTGPITFLGLLATNLSLEYLKTYKHKYLIPATILFSIIFLLGAQIIMEKVFNNNITVSIIINFIGGLYLLSMILRRKK